jgi:hypothetical protein
VEFGVHFYTGKETNPYPPGNRTLVIQRVFRGKIVVVCLIKQHTVKKYEGVDM